MLRRYGILIPLTCIVLFVLIPILGCTGGRGEKPRDVDAGRTDPAGVGRAVTPDAPAVDDSLDAGDGSDEQAGSDGGSRNYSTAPPSQPPSSGPSTLPPETQPSEIDLTMLVEGTEHPTDRPLRLPEGIEVEIEFVLTASGAELDWFEIRSADPEGEPMTGDLNSFEANILYPVVYNSRTWGQGGITVVVTNTQGDASWTNILVMPAAAQGLPPT